MANGQVVAEWFHLLWQLTPLPSPLLPLSQSSLAETFGRYTPAVAKKCSVNLELRPGDVVINRVTKMFSKFRVRQDNWCCYPQSYNNVQWILSPARQDRWCCYQQSYQNVQWISSSAGRTCDVSINRVTKMFSGFRVQQGRTGDSICHQSYGGPQIRDQWRER